MGHWSEVAQLWQEEGPEFHFQGISESEGEEFTHSVLRLVDSLLDDEPQQFTAKSAFNIKVMMVMIISNLLY